MNSKRKILIWFTFIPGFLPGRYADGVFFKGTDSIPDLRDTRRNTVYKLLN